MYRFVVKSILFNYLPTYLSNSHLSIYSIYLSVGLLFIFVFEAYAIVYIIRGLDEF